MSAIAVRQSGGYDLATIDAECFAIEARARECSSVPEIKDMTNKLGAIDEYLARTSTDGRARVQAAMRRLEARIGELLPKFPNNDRRSQEFQVQRDVLETATNGWTLHKGILGDFRQMAANPDVVETVIAESTDDRPPSRRKVMEAIKGPKREGWREARERRRFFAHDVDRIRGRLDADASFANRLRQMRDVEGAIAQALDDRAGQIDDLLSALDVVAKYTRLMKRALQLTTGRATLSVVDGDA